MTCRNIWLVRLSFAGDFLWVRGWGCVCWSVCVCVCVGHQTSTSSASTCPDTTSQTRSALVLLPKEHMSAMSEFCWVHFELEAEVLPLFLLSFLKRYSTMSFRSKITFRRKMKSKRVRSDFTRMSIVSICVSVSVSVESRSRCATTLHSIYWLSHGYSLLCCRAMW